jgi:plastocyanin
MLTLLFAAAGATQVLAQGAVSGTVKFTGTPPANPKIDMTEEPTCKSKYTGAITEPVVTVNKGGLANAFIYVKTGLPAGAKHPAPATPVVIDQTGCLYKPRILGVMTGQGIEIRNSDAVLHNIKAVPKKNRGFNVSQPTAGMKTVKTFPTAELAVPFECNVHGWMHAKVFVMDNPYFAVSDDNGAFSIKGLPPGTYTLEAWHEKLGTKTATVTVTATGGTTSFTFAAS